MENSIWKGIHPLKWKIVHKKENLALVMVNYTMMQVYITWSVKSLFTVWNYVIEILVFGALGWNDCR